MALRFITTETQVNGTSAGNQRAPSTAVLAGGGYVTVWASDSGDGSGKSIMGQRFAADGSKVGAEFLINTTTDGDQDLPDVVSMPSVSSGNHFFVVWQSAEAGGSVIRARRFLEDGTPARFLQSDINSPTTDVVVSGTFGGSKPSAGLYGTERLAIVWEAPSGDGSGTAIVMARYRFSLIDPVVVNTTTAGNQVDPRVGFRAEVGGLGIVWESQEPTGDVIRGRVIFPASSQDADTVVSDGVGEDESLPNFAQNGTLAIWNSGTSIKAATLPISGGVQPSFVLNTTPGGVISRSEILRLADGTYLAVYFTQSGDDGSSYSLRVERFSASGESYSPEILVPEKFTGAQEAPSVVQLANGNVVITWASEADELGNFEVKQRLLDIYGPEVGDSGDNVLTGTPDSNLFLLHQGGEDTASGLAGNDNFYFGAELSAGDMVDGGEGTLDQLGLQGNYGTFGAGASPFTLGSNHLVNVEMLVLLSGSDSRFGDSAGNFYSYNIATLDGHVAAGQQLVVSFNTLRSGENVTFDGSAETNGSFMTYGGLGTDILTGGQQSDSFYFGADGRFGAGDRVDGRGGSLDQLGLQGDYSGARAVTFAADSMTSIEMIVLLGAGDARFGGGSADGFSYDIVMNDANVAEGSRMYISANTLRSDHLFNETLDFDGSAEKDGFFTIYAGAGADTLVGGERSDEIWGRGGADRITGGLGADVLRGGAGNDVFAYDSIAHSSAVSSDRIMDFATGDVIALSTIDANGGTADDDAFVFIGSAAFTMGTAGQLRAYEDSAQAGHWFVEADVNGDGEADLVIEVFTTDLQPLDAADFVL